MSKYWGYRCKQDGTTTDQYFNHGERVLSSLAHCWPLILDIEKRDTSGYLEMHILGHQYAEEELYTFLREHLEHGIELCNEYGEGEPLIPQAQGEEAKSE